MSEEIYKRYKGLIDPIFSMTGMPPRGKELLISVFTTIRMDALADVKEAVVDCKKFKFCQADPILIELKEAIAAIESLEVKP